MNKICIYAICKNEMKWIDNWINSMSEADYIVVLDTGSTDGSFEKLKNDSRITRVEQKIINPWRFDVARNESLKLVPDDANILMCTDFDETLNKGWSKELRESWDDTKYVRAEYKYIWGRTDSGEATDVFMYDKIHNREFKWLYAVHEVLWPIVGNMPNRDKFLKLKNVVLEHHAERNKDRSNYTSLLEISCKEHPYDPHINTLLAREYAAYGKDNLAVNKMLEILSYPSIVGNETGIQPYKFYCLYNIAILYGKNKNYSEAVKYLFMAIKEDSTMLEPYITLSEIFLEIGMYDTAISIIEEGKNKAHQHFVWYESSYTWVNAIPDVLSRAYYFKKDYSIAYKLLKYAIEKNPSDERLLKNMIEFEKALIDSSVNYL